MAETHSTAGHLTAMEERGLDPSKSVSQDGQASRGYIKLTSSVIGDSNGYGEGA